MHAENMAFDQRYCVQDFSRVQARSANSALVLRDTAHRAPWQLCACCQSLPDAHTDVPGNHCSS